MTELENLERPFRSLGDPTRLRIVAYLGCCPDAVNCAGDVCCAVSGASTINATVSHHLRELRDAGVVSVERDGRARRYTLRTDTLRAMHDALGRLIEQVEGA